MPAYNAGAYIEQSIQSLTRQQRSVQLDIVVIDDGSSDETVAVVHGLMTHHPEVRLIASSHAGVSAARNRGLDHLPDSVEFVTFHDADDIAYPGRIARQLARLQADPHLMVVYGLLQLFDVLDDDQLLPAPHARTATVHGVSLSAGLYRRAVIDRIGRFDENLLQAEDTDFLFRLVESGALIVMEDEIATFYRRHDSNTTNDYRAARREFMKAVHMSIKRRRLAPGPTIAPLAGGMFADRSQFEEQFSCPPNTRW
jgi:glycosyltransferase involved in cell wall biosynthesis